MNHPKYGGAAFGRPAILIVFLPQLGFAVGALTYFVQKDWSDGAENSSEFRFPGPVPRISGSPASSDLGFPSFVLLYFVMLSFALVLP